jgi:hypothetical protein
VSLYLCWPERDLLTLGPLIELVWDCLINDMVDTYDARRGQGCTRTLLVLDEIFRSGMKKLPEYATTVCGRNLNSLVSPVPIAAGTPLVFNFEAARFEAQTVREERLQLIPKPSIPRVRQEWMMKAYPPSSYFNTIYNLSQTKATYAKQQSIMVDVGFLDFWSAAERHSFIITSGIISRAQSFPDTLCLLSVMRNQSEQGDIKLFLSDDFINKSHQCYVFDLHFYAPCIH